MSGMWWVAMPTQLSTANIWAICQRCDGTAVPVTAYPLDKQDISDVGVRNSCSLDGEVEGVAEREREKSITPEEVRQHGTEIMTRRSSMQQESPRKSESAFESMQKSLS